MRMSELVQNGMITSASHMTWCRLRAMAYPQGRANVMVITVERAATHKVRRNTRMKFGFNICR